MIVIAENNSIPKLRFVTRFPIGEIQFNTIEGFILMLHGSRTNSIQHKIWFSHSPTWKKLFLRSILNLVLSEFSAKKCFRKMLKSCSYDD